MRTNVGAPDRIARLVVLGAALVLLPFLSGLDLFANPVWLWASVIVGAALIVTALTRSCLLYSTLGLSTYGFPTDD